MNKTDGADDILLQNIINSLSKRAMFELLQRGVKTIARIEYRDMGINQRSYFMSACPIDTTKTLKVYYNNDSPRDWSNPAAEIDPIYIICDPERADRGEILVDTRMALIPAPDCMKFTYTAGMAIDSPGFIANYPDLAMAVDMQAAFVFQRRLEQGIASQIIAGASVSFNRAVQWLPDVLDHFAVYRRASTEGL